jgi:hypothetical protein
MGSARSKASANLRLTIDKLPRHTRVAMLDGIETNPIIVGAYANRDGICPMLAAHRSGGRTAVIEFAKAWDRFAYRHVWRGRPRRASKHELLILRLYLQASLLADPEPYATVPEPAAAASEPAAAASEPAAAASEPAAAPRTPVSAQGQGAEPEVEQSLDRDRAAELASTDGWAWTPATRSYDDYRRTLTKLGCELAAAPHSLHERPALRD